MTRLLAVAVGFAAGWWIAGRVARSTEAYLARVEQVAADLRGPAEPRSGAVW